MRIFLSHASEDKQTAEALAFSLRNRGHRVFLDRDDLPPGESYDKQIELAVRETDLFIFLISPASVVRGRYTLTELSFARKRWPDPHGRLLPVMVSPTPMDTIPSYLKAVTLLEPLGSVTAETAAAVDDLGSFSKAKAVAWKFAAFGAAGGILGSFLPYKGPSIFGFRVLAVAPDLGILIGAILAAAVYWILKIKDAAILLKVAITAVPIWFVLAWTMDTLPFQFVPETATQLDDLPMLGDAAVDEETKEKVRQSLEYAGHYSSTMNWVWSCFIFICLGAGFAVSITSAIGFVLSASATSRDMLLAAGLGALSGLLWKITYTRDIVDVGRTVLIGGGNEDVFTIWTSLGLMLILAQWLAFSLAAVGYNLGRNYRG